MDKLLLSDGTSSLLLSDGVSELLLSGESAGDPLTCSDVTTLSAAFMLMPFRCILPCETIDQAGQQIAMWLYGGVLAGELEEPVIRSILRIAAIDTYSPFVRTGTYSPAVVTDTYSPLVTPQGTPQ